MTIVEFPTPKAMEFMVGPFAEWRVQIEGRMIPRLTAYREGNGVCLVLDNRFGLMCENDGVAYQTAAFVANALAIGEGYSHLAADTKDRPFAPKGMGITLKNDSQ